MTGWFGKHVGEQQHISTARSTLEIPETYRPWLIGALSWAQQVHYFRQASISFQKLVQAQVVYPQQPTWLLVLQLAPALQASSSRLRPLLLQVQPPRELSPQRLVLRQQAILLGQRLPPMEVVRSLELALAQPALLFQPLPLL